MRVSYPRTPHLPWSPGVSADDVRCGGVAHLDGREVVVTEKLDGENTTLYRDGLHARSLDSAHHPSRAWAKALHGRIAGRLPEGWRVCGENLYARHSIPYDDLESYFYGFSLWDAQHCLDWDSTVRFLRGLGIPTPRVLWRGVYDERVIRGLRLDTSRQEGYVVRTADGFEFAQFAERVAKWVRPAHVQTDTHWMHTDVVPNGLGASAALWAVRSGVDIAAGELATALGSAADDSGDDSADLDRDKTLAEVYSHMDTSDRTGDQRLAGAIAALCHTTRRAHVMASLARPLGMPLARRVADLIGLAPKLHAAFPDEGRRAGLARMSFGTDLLTLHALAASTAPDSEAADHVAWSALFAEDAGLLPESPLTALRSACRPAFSDLAPHAADRCWAQARELFAEGRVAGVEEAVAATWRWRGGDFPTVVHLVGPSASGKSTTAGSMTSGGDEGTAITAVISLDDLRAERGSRARQSANRLVLTDAIQRLEEALGRGESVVWDATSLTRQQRGLVDSVAHRRNALIKHVVLVAEERDLQYRNTRREHPVPPEVLTAQLRRFDPPYPGEAHHIRYLGPDADSAVDSDVDALRPTCWEG
jgi:predicted kinase